MPRDVEALVTTSRKIAHFTFKHELPEHFKLTKESQTLYDIGVPDQGYIGLLDLTTGDIHLIPAYNPMYEICLLTDNMPIEPRKLYIRQAGEGLEYTVINPDHVVVSNTLTQAELNHTFTSPLKLEELRKFYSNIILATTLKHDTADYPNKFALLDEKGQLRKDKQGRIMVSYADKNNHILPTFLESLEPLGSSTGDLHKNFASLKGLVEKAGTAGSLLGFGIWKGKTGIFSQLRNRSSSQNPFAFTYDPLFYDYTTKRSLLYENLPIPLSRQIPSEIFSKIVTTISQAVTVENKSEDLLKKFPIADAVKIQYDIERDWEEKNNVCIMRLMMHYLYAKDEKAIDQILQFKNTAGLYPYQDLGVAKLLTSIPTLDSQAFNQQIAQLTKTNKEAACQILWMAIMTAARTGADTALLQLVQNPLVQQESALFKDYFTQADTLDGTLAIFYALENCQLEAIKALLSIKGRQDKLDLTEFAYVHAKESQSALIRDKTTPQIYTIFCAIESGHIHFLKNLFSLELIDTDKMLLNGRTPLKFAIEFGHAEAAKVLLDNHAEVSFDLLTSVIKNHPKMLPIVLTAPAVNLVLITAVLEHSINHIPPNKTATEQLVALLKTTIPELTTTALNHILAGTISSRDNIKYLVELGANINEKVKGDTPLFRACRYNNTLAMTCLLEQKADVNSVSSNNMTALHMAAINQAPRAFKLLIEHGADVTLKDQQGKTAYDYADLNPDFRERIATTAAPTSSLLTHSIFSVTPEPPKDKITATPPSENKVNKPD